MKLCGSLNSPDYLSHMLALVASAGIPADLEPVGLYLCVLSMYTATGSSLVTFLLSSHLCSFIVFPGWTGNNYHLICPMTKNAP